MTNEHSAQTTARAAEPRELADKDANGRAGGHAGTKPAQHSGKQRKRPPLRKIGPPLSPPRVSGRLLVRVAPSQVGMFRFLLEAYEHVAYFTVLNKYEALLKIVFSPHRERAARQALKEIGWSLPIDIMEWPSTMQNMLTSSALCTTQES